MEYVSVAAAASMIGISTQAVYTLIRQGRLSRVDGGGPIRLVASEVRLTARNRVDPQRLAAQVVAMLRPPPPEMVTLTDGRQVVHPSQFAFHGDRVVSLVRKGGVSVIPHLPPAAAATFGLAVLTAAARPVPVGSCRTCYADTLARGWDTIHPQDDAPTRTLLGMPCAKDRARWKAQADAANVDVHRKLDEMRERAARQALGRVSGAAARLRGEMSAASRVAPQSAVRASAGQPPAALTASADPPSPPRLDPRRDLTAAQARELAARRARRADVARRDGVQW